MESKLNDAIFDQLKTLMEGGSFNTELLYKICTDQASEKEKEEWKNTTQLSDEVNEQLKQSYSVGYGIASKLDLSHHDDFVEEFRSVVSEFRSIVEELRSDITDLKRKVDDLVSLEKN